MPKSSYTATYICEAEVAEGLESFTREEIRENFPQTARLEPQNDKGSVRFRFAGDLRSLSRLKTVEAVFLVQPYAVPRPRALLGDANFQLLLRQVDEVRSLYPGEFQSLYLSAAGAHTPVMTRIKEDLSHQSGLKSAEDKGDLLLRIRPSAAGGWETLVRLTTRPLVTRSWRVCNYEASLNATVAHVMALLTQPQTRDIFVNLGCGSGTLLIERLAAKKAAQMIGIDQNQALLECAAANIQASGNKSGVQLWQADIGSTPLPSGIADSIVADLPFGQKVGTHQLNRVLYPRVLREAERIAKPGARFVLITHEIRLIRDLLENQSIWMTEQHIRVTLRGLHPAIYVLRKS